MVQLAPGRVRRTHPVQPSRAVLHVDGVQGSVDHGQVHQLRRLPAGTGA
ncbi:MAG: hypothetical protein IPG94_08240 [Kineosporiaceae bacterium]|nr:hypothetical protein [Kineosporiaceae bacterium]